MIALLKTNSGLVLPRILLGSLEGSGSRPTHSRDLFFCTAASSLFLKTMSHLLYPKVCRCYAKSMIDWRILAIGAPLLFVVYQAFAKSLPKGTSSLLAGAYALGIATVMLFVLYLLTQDNKSLHLPSKTTWLTLGMGTGLALGNFGIIKAFSLGAPQSTFSFLFYVTLIIYGIIFGLLLWKEKLQLIQVAGVALAFTGIFLAVYFKKG